MKRILAYLIDMMIVTLLTSCLATLPIINVNYNTYENKVDKYNERIEPYVDFLNDFKKEYKDKKLDDEEFDKLQKDYIEIINLEEYFNDRQITETEYDEIYEKVYDEYNQIYRDSNYELMKINYIPSIITMVITILYFVVFGYFCNGQTLGKKMLQLQVVSKEGNRANILKLLLRTVILTGILTSILNLILLFSVNKEVYFVANEYIGIVSGIIEMIILVMVLYRKDKRGLHDMISGTKVIDLKIINSSNVIEAEIVKEIEQKEKDKVDEEQERLRARFK